MPAEQELPSFLTKEMLEELTKQFYKTVRLVVRQIRQFAQESGKATDIDFRRLYVSEPELASAFREAEKDLRFLMHRRGFSAKDVETKGVAEGKIAGMIAFRLLRHRIIHIGHTVPRITDRFAGRVQELVVLRLVSESILGIQLDKSPFVQPGPGGVTKPWLIHELLYLIARRHFNQETLALIFDTAVHLHKATSYSRI
ncbi:hypothetical protein FZ983_15810 [Azospirillum sp. B21]|uniref:hypothetical protein n=1 Tax=Azospirillum sp. B21 TaxID=2607496 RepID=UPI0011F07ACD|nr:hypothetical protein [Azospirillum sp. B21]KAA0578813.1 hypothetical protein FZ983_15810 [Azospirillum sp. B21]